MKCPNCGEIIKEKKLNFCGFCGSNLKTGEKTLTAPVDPKNNSFNNDVADAVSSFKPASAASANLDTAPPMNTNYASPFEQMVKANAAAQGVNGFQTSITPPSFNNFDPVPEAPAFNAPPASFDNFSQQTPPQVTPVNPVSAPADFTAPVSPIASFDPSSLSAFNPYNTAPPKSEAPVFPESPVIPAEPASLFPSEFQPEPQLAAMISEEDAKEHEVISKQLDELKNRHSSFEPSLNISKNVQMRNASDDPDSAPVPYMEYTKSTDRSNDKFSSFSFASPAETAAPVQEEPAPEINPESVEEIIKESAPPAIQEPAPEVKTEPVPAAEPEKKSDAKADLKETLESVLNFTTYKSSINLSKEDEKNADKASGAVTDTIVEAPAAKLDDEPVRPSVPEPEPVQEPAPQPEPEPEPEPVKEKVINYVGQDRKTAEQMLSFKGLVPEIEYVEDEKEYDFIISQSVPADTDVLPGTVIKLTVSAGTWTEWTENAIPVPASKYITETKTEYRRRSRTRTIDKRDTTDTSEYEDYTLVGSDSKYSDWETDQYYTSEAIPPGDTCEIIRMTSGFKYAGWFNPANLNGMSFSSPDVANFFNTNLSNVKWNYEEVISMDNVKPDVKNWKLVTDNMTSTPAGDPMISNIFFSAHVVDGKSYAMKYGSVETEWYIYKRRTLLETVYHFEKEIISDWSEWTEWSEKEHAASDDCQVESRTLTRSRRKLPSES